jgi:hypothetical protein
MLATLLCVCCAAVAADEPVKSAPPARKEIFAKEDWYKSQSGAEKAFVGILRKLERKGDTVGFGRFNPYRLAIQAKGKQDDIREVYVGASLQALAPYVGKRVKLMGKAVEMEVEGTIHREIWPARVEVLENKADPSESPARPAPGNDDKPAAQGKPVTVIAATAARLGGGKGHQVVRSASELAKLMNNRDGEEAATRLVAKLLGVKNIDWDKQMVIVVSGGMQRTGGYSVDVKSVTLTDKGLKVSWMLNTPKPGSFVTQAFTHPSRTILVERQDGEVRFDPPAPPNGKKPNSD